MTFAARLALLLCASKGKMSIESGQRHQKILDVFVENFFIQTEAKRGLAYHQRRNVFVYHRTFSSVYHHGSAVHKNNSLRFDDMQLFELMICSLTTDDIQLFELMICSLTTDDIQVASNLMKKQSSTYEKRTQVKPKSNGKVRFRFFFCKNPVFLFYFHLRERYGLARL